MISTVSIAIILLVSSTALSCLLTWILRGHCERNGFVAIPKADRYNRKTIALGGGVAIFWTLAIFIVSGLFITKHLILGGKLAFVSEELIQTAQGITNVTSAIWVVLGCITALHVLGFVDDKKYLGPFLKLAVQFSVAAAASWFADIRLELFIENKIITTAMSAFWIVLIMNAFNFLDNMDGLSVGIAAICCAVLLTAAIISGQLFISALSIVFIGTLLGFLVFNFPPAKIFMGDSGSLVVGFIVALLTLRTTYFHEGGGANYHAVFMPLVAMAVPLYDFLSVTLLRISQGKSPFVGDTQHFSHRMRKRGLSDTQTALTLYLATLCTGLGAISLHKANLFGAIIIFAQTIMILLIIAILEMTGKNDKAN